MLVGCVVAAVLIHLHTRSQSERKLLLEWDPVTPRGHRIEMSGTTAWTVVRAAPVQPRRGSVMSTTSHPVAEGTSHRALHRAWWSLLLFPVSFAVAVLVGTGVPSLFGYSEPSLSTTPWWVIALAFVAAFVVFAAPYPVTAHFSNQAVAQGEQRGRLPLVVAGVAVAGFVVVNLGAGLVQFLS